MHLVQSLSVILAVLVVHFDKLVQADGDDDYVYLIAMRDVTKVCPNPDGGLISCDVALTSDDENAMMSGLIKTTKDLDEDIRMSVDVVKLTDTGEEPVFGFLSSICECLKEDDAPWSPVFEALGISSCPIAKGDYPMSNMSLSLDFAEPVLTHEYVGSYKAELCLTNTQKEKLSCHRLDLEIIETTPEK